jgi:hypothetical protein
MYSAQASTLSCAVIGAVLAGSAIADVNAPITVDGGSIATVTVELSIDSIFGIQTSVDTITVGVDGGGEFVLGPAAEPFQAVDIASLAFNLGNGTLIYDDLFCVPIFGCQEIGVTANDLTLTMIDVPSSPIDSQGSATFEAQWNMVLNYDLDGDLIVLSGAADETESATFSTTIIANDGEVSCTDLDLGPILGVIPAEDLPVGVFSVTLNTTVNLANASMSGTYEPVAVVGDLNADGLVDGADLGILLSQFGAQGTADFDNSGTVNGADLGIMLTNWSA